ncbi:MAG: L,D-transpeptidase family protein [Candidatus Brocadiia bacterium]|jgi:hypothetical protein|nr:L,D-transpeptidase family protein [Candidatus Brocadiia bacterium]
MGKRRFIAIVLLLACAAGAALAYRFGRPLWHPVWVRLRGRRTVEAVLSDSGPQAEAPLAASFERAGVPYPPDRVALLAFKEERMLELWARKGDGWAFVRSYPVLAASGHAGPKLREGDRQVPEGVYRVAGLNPNSSYHLSMKLNYPNKYDWARARRDGRAQPGSDIFIHGNAVSIGCLAMGDEAIEELFCLVARMWPTEVKVLIAPNDIRGARPALTHPSNPPWTGELYGQLRQELGAFGRPARGRAVADLP